MSAQPLDRPPQSARDVIASLGKPITLVDGSTVRLRYSLASLRVLEERFGSLRGIKTEIDAAKTGLSPDAPAGAKGPLFTILSDALLAGLVHVTREDVDDDGRRVRFKLGRDRDRAEELLDPAQLQAYMEAFADALQESFGDLAGGVGEAAIQAAQPSSLGESGTTSGPSSPAAPTVSSGA